MARPPKLHRIDQQNRVALPPKIMEELGWKNGDYVRVERDGKAVKIIRVQVQPDQ